MIDPSRHPRLLRVVTFFDRVQAFLRRRHGHARQAEQNLASFYETMWREAANRVGATVVSLGYGVFEIRLGDFRTRVMGNTTDLDGLVTHCLARTKPLIFRLLAEQQLPVPRHIEFSLETLTSAVDFMEGIGGDCVLKPASGTGGGLGVITGIRTRWQLARAAYATARHGGDLLLEEQVPGDNYRLLYLDGRLIDAIVRHPPRVMGDGRSSIGELVQAANADRVKRGAVAAHVLLTVDMDMQRTLAGQKLTLSSVPAPGTVVTLKTAINENGGEDNESARDRLCPAVIVDGARAAHLAGVRLAGVDLITRDPTVPLSEAGGVILEVNAPPGYYWHYYQRGGTFPVAVHVLETLLRDHQSAGLLEAIP
jgi:cyanophycin synthetase